MRDWTEEAVSSARAEEAPLAGAAERPAEVTKGVLLSGVSTVPRSYKEKGEEEEDGA
jgi:hypothetical protein